MNRAHALGAAVGMFAAFAVYKLALRDGIISLAGSAAEDALDARTFDFPAPFGTGSRLRDISPTIPATLAGALTTALRRTLP